MVLTANRISRGSVRAVVVAIVLVLMAACGSSGSGSSGRTAGTAESGPKGTPFKIGYICFCANFGAASTGNAFRAFEGWVKWKNANGGINGHPVQAVTRNDPGNPGVALKQVKELVGEGVVALVSNDSSNDEAWASYIESTGIPVFNTVVGSAKLAMSLNAFSTAVSLVYNPAGIVASAKKSGVRRLALFYCAEVAACKQLVPVLKDASKTAGVDISFAASVLSTAPNYTAQCLAAKDANADGLFVAGAPSTALRVVASCAQQGYGARLVSYGQSFSREFEGQPGTDNMIAFAPNIPFYKTDFGGIKTMTAAYDKYEKGLTGSPAYNDTAVVQWTTGQLIAEAAVAGKVGVAREPSGPDLLEAMYTLRSTNLDGMTPQLTFVKGQPHLNKCWFYAGIEDNKFATPYGLTPSCAS